MIALETTADGVSVPVRVRPSARRNGVAGSHDGALRIDVTEAPEHGKANLAVVRVLSDVLRVAKSRIELASGATNSRKRFQVRGLDLHAAQALIQSALDGVE